MNQESSDDMSQASPVRALFITWDGDAQDYMSSLFLPLLGRAQRPGLQIDVCQFTWASDDARARIAERAQAHGVRYQGHALWRRPALPAAAAMIARGAAHLAWQAPDYDLWMPRSIMPAAMTLSASSMRRAWPGQGQAPGLVFDADGLSADERVDFAGWSPTGPMYRLYREIEAQTLRRARAVMTRTRAARDVLVARAGAGFAAEAVHVIPNGKDAARFHPGDEASRRRTRAQEGVPEDAPWLLCVGSLGPQYYPAQLLTLFERLWRLDARSRLHVLTGQPGEITSRLPDAPWAKHVWVGRVLPEVVPEYLAACTASVALRAPTFSQRGVHPIKVAESLLCGAPVLATRGVGDLDLDLDSSVGYLMDTPSPEALEGAARWIITQAGDARARDALRARCRARGLERYDLDRCAQALAQLLTRAARAPTPEAPP